MPPLAVPSFSTAGVSRQAVHTLHMQDGRNCCICDPAEQASHAFFAGSEFHCVFRRLRGLIKPNSGVASSKTPKLTGPNITCHSPSSTS